MLNTQTTLETALTFASDLVHGEWTEWDVWETPASMERTHVIHCETSYAYITVCTATGEIEHFKFHTKGDK